MPKSTKAELNQRVNDVYKLILSGVDTAGIVLFASEKWEVSSRQTQTYIKRANARIAEAAQTSRAEQYALAVAQLNSLYAAAVRLQDYRTALSVRRDLTSLLHLTPPPPSPQPVALRTPADVWTLLETEAGAALRGEAAPDHVRLITLLAETALRLQETADLAARVAALETRKDDLK